MSPRKPFDYKYLTLSQLGKEMNRINFYGIIVKIKQDFVWKNKNYHAVLGLIDETIHNRYYTLHLYSKKIPDFNFKLGSILRAHRAKIEIFDNQYDGRVFRMEDVVLFSRLRRDDAVHYKSSADSITFTKVDRNRIKELRLYTEKWWQNEDSWQYSLVNSEITPPPKPNDRAALKNNEDITASLKTNGSAPTTDSQEIPSSSKNNGTDASPKIQKTKFPNPFYLLDRKARDSNTKLSLDELLEFQKDFNEPSNRTSLENNQPNNGTINDEQTPEKMTPSVKKKNTKQRAFLLQEVEQIPRKRLFSEEEEEKNNTNSSNLEIEPERPSSRASIVSISSVVTVRCHNENSDSLKEDAFNKGKGTPEPSSSLTIHETDSASIDGQNSLVNGTPILMKKAVLFVKCFPKLAELEKDDTGGLVNTFCSKCLKVVKFHYAKLIGRTQKVPCCLICLDKGEFNAVDFRFEIAFFAMGNNKDEKYVLLFNNENDKTTFFGCTVDDYKKSKEQQNVIHQSLRRLFEKRERRVVSITRAQVEGEGREVFYLSGVQLATLIQ